MSILNLWLHHRDGPKGFIHPSKRMLAKKAKCSERSVNYALAMLREKGVLVCLAHATGGGRTAPHYKVDIITMLYECGCDLPREFDGGLTVYTGTRGVQNCTPANTNFAPLRDADFAPCNVRVRHGSNSSLNQQTHSDAVS